MTAYYNENDPKAAAWLRELVRRDLIAPGEVDERDIRDVKPSELKGFVQHYFFAGIGVWSYALRQAGWPDDRPVWTGSCPCQPFSAAGRGAGITDERHLWPHFFHLSQHAKPRDVPIFGEQVASKDGLGWLDLVQTDMEGSGHTFGAVDTCAAGFGAPHWRQRLYWLAYTNDAGPQRREGMPERPDQRVAGSNGLDDGLADAAGGGLSERRSRQSNGPEEIEQSERLRSNDAAGPTNGFWRDADWLFCRDGKWRPVEPGASPLAHGAAARVGRLRGYGNAIVAPQAKAFIQSYLEVTA